MSSSAAIQMLSGALRSARASHVARSHLFLASRAGLTRGKYWREAMASDVLVYDYQDGMPPGEDDNVSQSIKLSHRIFPQSISSVRISQLHCEDTNQSLESTVLQQIEVSLSQSQVYWLMLPMCDTSSDVKHFIDIINDVNRDWLKRHGQLQIICETPR